MMGGIRVSAVERATQAKTAKPQMIRLRKLRMHFPFCWVGNENPPTG
jgi:hypothetical protein